MRTSHHIDNSEYGIDGGKKIKGRKEHIVVDTLGLPMSVKVHAANIHDSVGAVSTIEQLRFLYPRLKKIIADGGLRIPNRICRSYAANNMLPNNA